MFFCNYHTFIISGHCKSKYCDCSVPQIHDTANYTCNRDSTPCQRGYYRFRQSSIQSQCHHFYHLGHSNEFFTDTDSISAFGKDRDSCCDRCNHSGSCFYWILEQGWNSKVCDQASGKWTRSGLNWCIDIIYNVLPLISVLINWCLISVQYSFIDEPILYTLPDYDLFNE